MDYDDLVDLKQDIEEAKEKVATLKGRKDVLVEQLKEKWDVATPKQASKKPFLATMGSTHPSDP